MSNYCYHCMEKLGDDNTCNKCGATASEDVAPHLLRPGTIINNKYLVGDVLGEGGFGITYIGLDLNLDMKIAIKEFYPSGYVNRNNAVNDEVSKNVTKERQEFFENGLMRFLDEARNLAKLAGENGVVTVRDYFEENNTAYIVMEYIDGMTLKEYISTNGTIEAESAVRLLMPVIDSLIRVHENGLVHRDISPDNIMITKNNQAKLLDFGAARTVSASDNKSLSIILKHGYAPEEQYRSKGQQGPWTDIYAICATMYKCITGVTPDSANERLHSDEIKYPSVLDVEINPELEKIIMKGMSIHVEDRYSSMNDLALLLKKVIGIDVSGLEIITQGTQVDEDEKETVYREKRPADKTGKDLEEERQKEIEEKAKQEELQRQREAEEKAKQEELQRQMEVEEKARQEELQRQREAEEKARQEELQRQKELEDKKNKTKKRKLPVILGIIGGIIVLGLIVILAWPVGSTVSPSGSNSETVAKKEISQQDRDEIVFKNENSIDFVEPKNLLDEEAVNSILEEVEFDEEYLFGTHTIEAADTDISKDADNARGDFAKAVGFSKKTDSYGKYITKLPYQITAGKKSVSMDLNGLDNSYNVMRMNYFNEDGKAVSLLVAYELDDEAGELVCVPIVSESVNGKNVYSLSDEEEFTYTCHIQAGKGGTIVLENDGASVKLISKGYSDRSYSSFYNISIDIKDGELLDDYNIDSLSLRYYYSNNKVISSFNSIINGKQLYDGTAKYTKDGVLILYYTDGHKENTEYYSPQFVLFDCGDDGIILIDENGEEYKALKK